MRVFKNNVVRRVLWGDVKGKWLNYTMRSLMICTSHPACLGDKIEKNEMGRACSVYGGEERRGET
jgi:hypothetical protein